MLDYDRLAREYAAHRKIHPGVLKSLVSGGRCGPDSSILEVGCGTGNYIAGIQSMVPGSRCFGVDPSAEMLERAQEQSSTISFHQGRAEDLDLPSGAFDLIFSVDVIHHVQDHAAYYRAAARLLKPGGYICTVTDSEWVIKNRCPLTRFFPETAEVDLARYPGTAFLTSVMAGSGLESAREEMVEHRYQLEQSQAYRDRAFSSLHLISEEAFQRGLQRLTKQLASGPVSCVSRYSLIWGQRGV